MSMSWILAADTKGAIWNDTIYEMKSTKTKQLLGASKQNFSGSFLSGRKIRIFQKTNSKFNTNVNKARLLGAFW